MARIEGALEAVKVISAQWAVTIILALYACYMLIQYVRDPLRTVPGPFWARFTRLWYLKAVIGGRFEHTNIDLHRKYGTSTLLWLGGHADCPSRRLGCEDRSKLLLDR